MSIKEGKTTQPTRAWAAMIVLLLVASLLYLPRLNAAITYDEAYTLRHYAHSLPAALVDYELPNNHFLNSMLVWLSTNLAGDSEFAIRIPAFYAGILSIALIYRLGRQIADTRTGLAAALILMSMAGFIQYGTTARGYVFAVLLTLALIEQLVSKPRQKYGLLFSSMGLILTLPTMILLIVPCLIWSWRYYKQAILPICIGTLAGTVFYIPIGMQAYSSFPHFGQTTLPALFQDTWHYVYAGPGLVAVMILLALAGWFTLKGPARWLILLIFLLPILVFPIELSLLGSLFFGRTYLYLLPLLALLAGICVARFLRSYTPIGVGLALAVAVPLLWYRPETAAISRLLQQVDRHVTEDDAIILSCCLDEPLLYYERDHPSLFDVRNKEQIYLIESPHLGILDFQRVTGNRFACNRVDDWGEFSVYQCLPRE